MAKFIIEVSDDIIREKANIEVLKNSIQSDCNGYSVVKGFIQLVGYQSIKIQLDEGNTEFCLSRDDIKDEAINLFDDMIGDICILMGVKKGKL